MIYLWLLFWACINLNYAQQSYDYSECSADTSFPGSRYTCNSFKNSCHTFIVYRANTQFQTLSDITALFQINSNEILHLNKLTSSTERVKSGREVLIPIDCSCSGQFFEANFSYTVPGNTSYSDIACGVFEGLLKPHLLSAQNQSQENGPKIGSELHVPLKCACPDNFSVSEGVKYLLTYPFVEKDELSLLCEKFGISLEDLCAANLVAPKPTVYPTTTFLIPLKSDPNISFDITDLSPPPASGFLPTITIQKTNKVKLEILYIVVSVVGFTLLLLALLACGLYVKALRKWKGGRIQSFNTRSSTQVSFSTTKSSPRSAQTGHSSTNSCLSPDLLAGIKYSLSSYSLEDLKRATKNFGEDTKIGDQSYKGMIDNVEVMIKQMRFEDTRQVIDVNSKIHHINIVSLHGVCYGDSDFSWSYVVFEFPKNGCLRDCLSNSLTLINWPKRTQIAFDVATALHYLHHCIFPTYAHMSVSSRNIFITSTWRAKLSSIETNHAVGSSKGSDISAGLKGCIAPEYLLNRSASEKVDIFAYGVVLLELLSGREDVDGKFLRECIGFLGGGGSEGGCFEQLRSFMDPCLKEDYPLAEALCLAVLAKACVEDDPLHRPSMVDIIKVVGRMV